MLHPKRIFPFFRVTAPLQRGASTHWGGFAARKEHLLLSGTAVQPQKGARYYGEIVAPPKRAPTFRANPRPQKKTLSTFDVAPSQIKARPFVGVMDPSNLFMYYLFIKGSTVVSSFAEKQ